MAYVIAGAARRGARALRSVGPATVAVAVALIIGAAGFADAATGGNFILGKANTETSTAVLKDTTGIPLALNAPSGKSPLSVDSTIQVNRLNAQYLGGESATQLKSAGGVGITSPAVDIALPAATTTSVASTGALAAGTYYVSATALLYVGGAQPVYCRVLGAPTNWGGGSGSNYVQAAETTVVTVPANTIMSEVCYAIGSGQYVYNAAITAIRIDSSSTGTIQTENQGKAVAVPPRS